MILVEASHTIANPKSQTPFIILAGTKGEIVFDGYQNTDASQLRVKWHDAICIGPEAQRTHQRDFIHEVTAVYLRFVQATLAGDSSGSGNSTSSDSSGLANTGEVPGKGRRK